MINYSVIVVAVSHVGYDQTKTHSTLPATPSELVTHKTSRHSLSFSSIAGAISGLLYYRSAMPWVITLKFCPITEFGSVHVCVRDPFMCTSLHPSPPIYKRIRPLIDIFFRCQQGIWK